MDHGYPQFTEARILSEFIKTDAFKLEEAAKPPMAVTNAVSWRSEGLKYKKNEVFLDAVESVNLLVNSNGTVVVSEARRERVWGRGRGGGGCSSAGLPSALVPSLRCRLPPSLLPLSPSRPDSP